MATTSARPTELPAVLFVEDVARTLDLSIAQARRLMRRGEIPARKRGARWITRRDDFLGALTPTTGRRRRGAS